MLNSPPVYLCSATSCYLRLLVNTIGHVKSKLLHLWSDAALLGLAVAGHLCSLREVVKVLPWNVLACGRFLIRIIEVTVPLVPEFGHSIEGQDLSDLVLNALIRILLHQL